MSRTASSSTDVRRTGRRSTVSHHARGIWPLAIPALVVTAALIVVPIVWSVVLSLSVRGVDGFSLANLTRMAEDPLFWSSVRITLFFFVAGLVAQMVLGVALGYLLSIDIPGRRVLQGAILVPAITASVAVGLLWLLIFDANIGTANQLLAAIGLDPVVWLGDPAIAPWALVIVDTWQWTPFVALMVSAGIRSLPSDVFEAASIDGAAGWRMGRFIGLPLLAPVLTVAALLRTVDLMRFFDLSYIMTQGGPLNSTSTLNLYGYRQAFIYQDSEYAAALQLTLFAIVVLISAIFTIVRRRFTVEY